MSKPTPRHPELVQRERPKDGAAAVTAARGEAAGGDPTGGPPALEPGMARRYWLVIILWSLGFATMIVYEIIAVLWRT